MKNEDLKELVGEGLPKNESEPEYVVYKGRWLVLLSIVTVRSILQPLPAKSNAVVLNPHW
jgi:hypothetical protein